MAFSLFRGFTNRSTSSRESTESAPVILTPRTSNSNSDAHWADDETLVPSHTPIQSQSTYQSSYFFQDLRDSSAFATTAENHQPGSLLGEKGPLGLTCLYSPEDPKVDIIFVHGLGGDSAKTWCVSKRPETFWPREWIPREPGFENVRTWSWGYESNITGGEEVIYNIHHFGKSLVASLAHSRIFNSDQGEPTKIIAVGHSMGGLVLKKAFILASQDPTYQDLAQRFKAMAFLATPHHGADGAKMLATLLQSLGRDRRYIKDLAAKSDQIQVINDGFRHFSERLTLTSFYETQKSKVAGGAKRMIVEPRSAVLGYPGEKQVPLDADHRGICKFEDRSDRNYAAIRNTLGFMLNQITTEEASNLMVPGSTESKSAEELAREMARLQDEVRAYLDVGTAYDHDNVHARDARLPGSCEWMSEKEEFLAWRDGTGDENRILWLHAQPGSGKTVLAGYIIDHLRQLDKPCAHWYFKFADHKKSTLARCLKSVVFQMSKADPVILQAIGEMKNQGVKLEDIDSRQLLIYLRQFDVFTTSSKIQYWVVDAMDECSDIFPLLDALRALDDASLNIRMLFTSRLTRDLKMAFNKLSSSQTECTVTSVSISPEDTAPDLRKMIDFHLGPLDILEPDDPMIDEIIETSKGSLLWASLVLNEALECDTVKELRSILNAVPNTMDEFYERSLAMMSKNKRRIPLLKAVLRWACCAYTPLTLPELKQALNIELDDDYLKLRELIETNCGQLVTIDASGGLNVIHKSAGDYLTSGKEGSELCLDVREAHASMACICLSYLTGDEMKPPRSTKGRDFAKIADKRTVFHTYASTAFSYHMSMTDSSEPRILNLLEKFFSANVLSWIETNAAIFGLNRVTDASEHFNAYLQNCQAKDLSVTKQHQDLQEWAIDLGRLVSKFGHVLIDSPSSIFGLIPPVSPSCSMIHNIAPQTKTLTVVGKMRDSWDDRLVNLEMGHLRRGMKKTWDRTWEEATSHIMDYYPEAPMNVAYGQQHVAVSVPTETEDTVRVYNATSHELDYVFEHGEVIVGLQFDPNTGYLAVAGVATIRVVNVPRKLDMYMLSVPECPMCFDFFGAELRVVGQDRYIYTWRLGDEAEELPPIEHTKPETEAPLTGSISVGHNLLALGYPGARIDTWDLGENVCVSSMEIGPSKASMILSLEIQPNSGRDPLIASYWDNQMMALLDPFSERMVKFESLRCHTMTVSFDGRFIAAGLDFGIAIHDFDTLKELYMVRMAAEPCGQLRFSRDSKRLADTRGTNCIVWEPAILSLRDPVQYASLQSRGFMFRDYDVDDDTSVMAVHPTEDAIFCGRRNGDVVVYSRKDPHVPRILYKHKLGVSLVKWCPRQQAVLSTASKEICIQSVRNSATGWEAGHTYSIRRSMSRGIDDALVSNGTDQFVVASKGTYYLYDLESDDCREYAYEMRSEADIRYLAAHPRSAMHVVCVDETQIRIHHWADWSLIATVQIVPGPSGFDKIFTQNYLTLLNYEDEWHVLEHFSGYFRSEQYQPALCIRNGEHLIREDANTPGLAPTDLGKAGITSRLDHSELRSSIRHAIGVVGTRLIFLDKSSWICSYDLKIIEGAVGDDSTHGYLRHLYVPAEWLMPANWFVGRLVVCAISRNDLVFACMGGITIVRNFMQHSETVSHHRNV